VAIAGVGYTWHVAVAQRANAAPNERALVVSGAVWGGGDSLLSGAGSGGGTHGHTDFTVSEAARIAPRL
jgi:hypothetical protein